jgi:hypothetical protein
VGYVADLISAPVLTGFKIGIGISIAVGQLDSLLGVALIAFVESIAAARTFQRSEDRPVSADRELGALGLANVVPHCFAGRRQVGACRRPLSMMEPAAAVVLPRGEAGEAIRRFRHVFGSGEAQLFPTGSDAIEAHLDQLGGPTE